MIRKISVGPDYKGGAMHYLHGQQVLGGSHTIHLIRHDEKSKSIQIWIEKDGEVVLWKQFNQAVPVSLEFNINF